MVVKDFNMFSIKTSEVIDVFSIGLRNHQRTPKAWKGSNGWKKWTIKS